MSSNYVCVKVNALSRLIYLARRIIVTVPELIENRDIMTARVIHSILRDTRPRISELTPFDEGSLISNVDVNERTIQKYVKDLNFVISNPSTMDAAEFIESVLNDMIDCGQRLVKFAIELFVEHIGAADPSLNLMEVKKQDPQIDYIAERLESIYHLYYALDVVFSRFYWSFEFKNGAMKRTYALNQKLYWTIVEFAFAISADSDHLEPVFETLYIMSAYYDPDKSINWNLGLGYFKDKQVLTANEFKNMTHNSEEED